MAAAAAVTWPEVRLSPRRFGHVNMYVADLATSFAFYHDVCGLELVFDEPGIRALFLSNGNSHHDVALMGVSSQELRGRDGRVQVSRERGSAPGLNHLAFEMTTEARLVAGIERMRAGGLAVDRLFDHQISRSAYVSTPWSADLELYADAARDWRGLYAGLAGELLTERWEPGADGGASDEERFVDELDHRPVAGAPARPLRTTSATVAVPDLDQAIDYYETVIGLDAIAVDRGPTARWAVLAGELGLADLALVERQAAIGFHHLTLQVPAGDFEATLERLGDAGVECLATVHHELKRSVVLRDPDGVPVELAEYAAGITAASYAALVGQSLDPAFVV